MSLKARSTFVLVHPSEILAALVGLKDVVVLRYERRGPDVELMVEQLVRDVRCPTCDQTAQVKERPVVHYVDLPVYGTPMSLAWKKHRMRCVNPRCPKKSWVLEDHRIAAKNCLLTTRAAKWATVQVGGGRTVLEVADELACDWHTVNDAVITYGEALLEADRKRLNQTSAIGLDETSFVKLGDQIHTSFATTVADVENHQIIDILPTRKYTDVAGWIDKQPAPWKERIRFGALDMSTTYAAVYSVILPKATQVVDPFHVISLANRCLDAVRRRVQTEQLGHRGRRDDPLYRARRVLLMGEEKLDAEGPSVCGHSSSWAIPAPRSPSPIASRSGCVTSTARATSTRPANCSKSSATTASTRHAAGGPKTRTHDEELVRQDRQLPPGPGVQRAHRGAQQPDQAHQAHRLRVPQLRELPDPGAALCRQAELACAGLDRRPVTCRTPPESEEPDDPPTRVGVAHSDVMQDALQRTTNGMHLGC